MNDRQPNGLDMGKQGREPTAAIALIFACLTLLMGLFNPFWFALPIMGFPVTGYIALRAVRSHALGTGIVREDGIHLTKSRRILPWEELAEVGTRPPLLLELVGCDGAVTPIFVGGDTEGMKRYLTEARRERLAASAAGYRAPSNTGIADEDRE